MVREIIIPKKDTITLRIPQNMVGKTIELIAFEIKESIKKDTRNKRLEEIDNLTKSSLVELSGFTFDRNEANNYDD